MIHLEPIDLHHAPAVQILANNPLLAEMTRLPSPYPEGAAAAFILQTTTLRGLGKEYVFAVLQDNLVVGMCGLHQVPLNRESAEIGYWIGQAYWGQGIATEAIGQLCRVAFADMGIERVYAEILQRNLASRRVLEKNGFIYVRTRPNPEPRWIPGEPMDYFEKVRKTFAG